MTPTSGANACLYRNDQAIEAIEDRRIPVAVYGLGKMGLPLAAVLADVVGNVIGADIDESVVEAVNAGVSHVKREPGLDDLVHRTVESGDLAATGDIVTAARAASVHVVIVPTLIDDQNDPDLAALVAVIEAIGAELDENDLVIVESTVPPRTCEDDLLPILERESGLSLGEFGLAFCPERTASGRAIADIRGSYVKVVGGVDPESEAAARTLYEAVNSAGVVSVADCATAEAVKVFEGVYRDVNIALANELATFADDLGVDVVDAIETANTLPLCSIHSPGAGVGGHCIPYYPYFITSRVDSEAPLLRTARSVNDEMPAFVVSKLRDLLAEMERDVVGATVLVLGVTYRAGVEETRATPAGPIATTLTELGADVRTVDPLLDEEQLSEFPGSPSSLAELSTIDVDAAVIVTAHDEFRGIEWSRFEPMAIVDGRQFLDLGESHHAIYTVGRGRSGRAPGGHK